MKGRVEALAGRWAVGKAVACSVDRAVLRSCFACHSFAASADTGSVENDECQCSDGMCGALGKSICPDCRNVLPRGLEKHMTHERKKSNTKI